MRGLIVAAALVVAGPSGAADFGVSVDRFAAGVREFRTKPLASRGCKSDGELRLCLFSDQADVTRVFVHHDKSKVVTRLQFSLPAKTWAESGRILDEAQGALLISPARAVRGAEVTRFAKAGGADPLELTAPAVVCRFVILPNQPDLVAGYCDPR